MRPLVKDRNDPSGYGMFSKAGRFTTEKYSNAIHQFENLFQPRKETPVKHALREKNDEKYILTDPDQSLKLSIPEQKTLEKKKNVKNLLGVKKIQPFARSVSREKEQARYKDRNQPPPCGYYTPKDAFTKPNPKLVISFDSGLSSNQKVDTLARAILSSESPKRRIRGFYELRRQLPREKCLTIKTDPCEKRFELISTPGNWSKIPHRPKIEFSKQEGRRTRPVTSPDVCYEPAFSLVEKKIALNGPAFAYQTRRKPNILKVNCINQITNYDMDFWSNKSNVFPKYLLQITSKHQTFDIELYINDQQRQRSSDSTWIYAGIDAVIYIYQKNLNNRLVLNQLHQKMLEENSYITPHSQSRSKFSSLNKTIS